MKNIDHLIISPIKCRGCRSCQLACSFIKTEEFNPAKSMIRMERDVETGHTAPMILPLGCDLCNGDPACLKACTYGALSSGPERSDYRVLVQ